MKDYYFDRPTQVAFYNVDDDCYDAGITHGNYIVCLCCGGIFPIDELVEDVREVRPDIVPIIELPWVNLREECLGDAMFDANSGEIIV